MKIVIPIILALVVLTVVGSALAAPNKAPHWEMVKAVAPSPAPSALPPEPDTIACRTHGGWNGKEEDSSIVIQGSPTIIGIQAYDGSDALPPIPNSGQYVNNNQAIPVDVVYTCIDGFTEQWSLNNLRVTTNVQR